MRKVPSWFAAVVAVNGMATPYLVMSVPGGGEDTVWRRHGSAVEGFPGHLRHRRQTLHARVRAVGAEEVPVDLHVLGRPAVVVALWELGAHGPNMGVVVVDHVTLECDGVRQHVALELTAA